MSNRVMKLTGLLLMAILIMQLLGFQVNAEESISSLQDLTIDQLLILRTSINQTLQSKGYTVYYDITHGEKGENVAALQSRLAELGYYTSTISGKYDSETQKAVKRFQNDNGLISNGIATVETQVILYDSNTRPKPTATPKASHPTPTIDPKYQNYIAYDYTEAARYPDSYKGKKVIITGKVLQVVDSILNNCEIRLATSGYSDVVYITIPFRTEYKILENDRLTVYATTTGTKTYTSTFLQSITIPSAKADYIVLH